MKRKLPRNFGEVQLSDEQEMACVYVVNTCEYCLETIPKLHSMIEDKIQGFEIDLQEQSSIPFRELINTVLIALAKSVSLRLEPIYQA